MSDCLIPDINEPLRCFATDFTIRFIAAAMRTSDTEHTVKIPSNNPSHVVGKFLLVKLMLTLSKCSISIALLVNKIRYLSEVKSLNLCGIDPLALTRSSQSTVSFPSLPTWSELVRGMFNTTRHFWHVSSLNFYTCSPKGVLISSLLKLPGLSSPGCPVRRLFKTVWFSFCCHSCFSYL